MDCFAYSLTYSRLQVNTFTTTSLAIVNMKLVQLNAHVINIWMPSWMLIHGWYFDYILVHTSRQMVNDACN